MKITVGGMLGSGKSTIAEIVAKKLKLKFYSIGNIMRELATKRKLSINEYISLKEDVDSEIDNYQKNLGLKEDNFIVDGRLAFHFIPDSIKIFFDVNPEVGAERIFKNQRGSEKKYKNVNEALKSINSRIEEDKKRYKKLYNIDAYDKNNFDYVIDTTNLDIDAIAEKVIKIINDEKGYK